MPEADDESGRGNDDARAHRPVAGLRKNRAIAF